MAEPQRNPLELVQHYRQLVEAYEALDNKIDELIMASDGKTDLMSESDLAKYREWARQRTELLNDMRLLEQQLDITGDEGEPTGAN